jgi:long-chain acyl-CoA synthetase
VIGIPDEARGHAPKAFVVLHPGENVTPETLQSQVADRLSGTSVPREIVFRSSLPKSVAGKVLKDALH